MEKPTSSFWGQVLDNIPGFGGKRQYDRAEAYADRVHMDNPEEQLAYDKAGEKSYTVKGKLQRYAREVNDITTGDQFQNQTLGFPTDMPNRFIWQNKLEDMDRSALDETTFGTKAGHYLTQDGRFKRAVDKDYIAQGQVGKKFLGVIPYGYSGSVRQNPGINPNIDISQYQKQIKQSGTAPLLRMQMYQGD